MRVKLYRRLAYCQEAFSVTLGPSLASAVRAPPSDAVVAQRHGASLSP